MYRTCTIIILNSFIIGYYSLYSDFIEKDNWRWTPEMKSRCTRRFTPGTCLEQVMPVWTFEFYSQNCTERLGCFFSHRTNRFRSYKSCMKRCQYLADLYLQILSYKEMNNTDLFYLRKSNTGRRGSGKIDILETDESKDSNYENEREISDDENIRELYSDVREDMDDDISIPDIDICIPDIDISIPDIVNSGQRVDDENKDNSKVDDNTSDNDSTEMLMDSR